MEKRVRSWCAVICIGLTSACGFPRPPPLVEIDAYDASSTSSSDSSVSVCPANQPLRCSSNDLARCNSDGTAEVVEHCALGCSNNLLRCKDLDPSNGLAEQLDMSGAEPDFDLGASAMINTDDGTVLADGAPMAVRTALVAQASAPMIRVLIIHSLTAGAVTITGKNAFAIVSAGDVKIQGVFAASGRDGVPGPGGFDDSACKGRDAILLGVLHGGAGGGGFGDAGGRGGSATNDGGTAAGGEGGSPSGNAMLIPLRGGCDGGTFVNIFSGGGGAIQLVSRTKIAIQGFVAANGDGTVAGGSGGGILLEAPLIEVSGGIVANGGGGSGGCLIPKGAESGRLDARRAAGGPGCPPQGGDGGTGGAGTSGQGAIGASISISGTGSAFGAFGGGGVGRIRVNTLSGGLHSTAIFSPTPTTGPLATR
jgi:hypothetical protein